MLDIPDENSRIPLLSTVIQFDSSQPYPLEGEKKKNSMLSLLSDFHFSTKTLPSRQKCLKKYSIMLLSIGGGLGYWSAVEKYNQNHSLSEFESDSNINGTKIRKRLF